MTLLIDRLFLISGFNLKIGGEGMKYSKFQSNGFVMKKLELQVYKFYLKQISFLQSIGTTESYVILLANEIDRLQSNVYYIERYLLILTPMEQEMIKDLILNDQLTKEEIKKKYQLNDSTLKHYERNIIL